MRPMDAYKCTSSFWCCLLLFAPKRLLGQDEILSLPLNCSLFQVDDTMSIGKNVHATADALNKTANRLDSFVECTPANQSIVFDVPSVLVNGSVIIDKPLSLKASELVGQVQFHCPPEGTVFDIQSHCVIMLNFTFSDCSNNSKLPIKLSNCGSGQSLVDVFGVEFVSNLNSNGSAGIEVLGCNLRVRDSVFRNSCCERPAQGYM